MNRKVVDTFNGGIKLERGAKVEFDFPYKGTGTYLYPSMGVSNLTNAIVGCPGRPPMQYPASLLKVVGIVGT